MCDLCVARIDPSTNEVVTLDVKRGADHWDDDVWSDELTFVFCSQEHAGQFLTERPLPPVKGPDPEQGGWLDAAAGVGCAITAFAIMVGLLVGSAHGLWLLVRPWF